MSRAEAMSARFPSARPGACRAVVYARFSSDAQRDASIEDQLRVCRARADREGWSVSEVFTDYAISGATALRPGFQALLSALRAGRIDVVLTESLDRLSRDQEHIAGFFKHASFAGARIVTLAEGEVSELHVGLKGTMGALYLKDLADKTRRGLEGRVRQGRSGGGLSYGYRVVRGPVGRDGEAERGLREIDPAQAAVVRRIFEAFAGGEGPKRIAAALNRDGIAGPRGGLWQAGTLRGQAGRDTGILRNRLYIGELVWNQRRWIKDPSTGRRVARANGAASVVTEQVPALRIIETRLWDAVQARLSQQRAEVEPTPGGQERRRFWEQRRPQHILTGRVFCGHCGGAFAATGRDYLACRTAQAGGDCDNRRSVRRSRLEDAALEALQSGLMQPDAVAAFVEGFTAEWNRLSAERSAVLPGLRRELEQVDRQLERLVDAIADGLRAANLQARLDALSDRRAALVTELAAAEHQAAVPRLHPNLAGVYRERVSELRAALAADGGTEIREAVRALIAHVRIFSDRMELEGELSQLLAAAHASAAAGPRTQGHEPGVPEMFACSAKVDAGTSKLLDLLVCS